MQTLNTIMLTLLIIGGLNWGLVGVAQFDLVAAIFGEMSAVARVVYTLVGVAAIWCISLYGRVGASTPAEGGVGAE